MFKIYGVNPGHKPTLLEEFTRHNAAVSWAKRYALRENAGGHELIKVVGPGTDLVVHAVAMEG